MKQKKTAYKKQQLKRGKVADRKHARINSLKKKRKLASMMIDKQIEIMEKKQLKEMVRNVRKQQMQKLLVNENRTKNKENCLSDIESTVHEVEPTKQETSSAEEFQLEITNVKTSFYSVNTSDCIQAETLDDGNIIVRFANNNQLAIVTLSKNNEIFKLHGYGKITILKGKCSLNGFQMLPGDSQTSYAPISHPAMVLRLISNLEDVNFLCSVLEKKGIKQKTFQELQERKDIQNFAGLVLFESLASIEIPRKLPGFAHVYNMDSSHILSKKQLCSSYWKCETNEHRYFDEYSFYRKALTAILSYDQPQISDIYGICHSYPVTVTVGGKNVGKSTLNRYLVNRLLERHPHVYYLECDVGQTEFTPPGFISIHKIDKENALLGPPFTHQRSSKHLCYYGDKTPEGDPDRYIECIQYLFNQLQIDFHAGLAAPLIVNTNGWVRSLGARLLIDVIHTVSPTHVLQFESIDPTLNHKGDLTPSYMSITDGWKTKGGKKLRPFHFIKLNTDYSFKEGKKFKSQNLRCLSLLSNIDQIIQNCQSQQNLSPRGVSLLDDLQAINPYCVYLPHVVLCNALDKPVLHKYAEAAFNASIVGLCCVPDDVAASMKNPDDDVCLYRPPVCRCLGLGVVRGVDPKNRLAYVISDLTSSEIEQVNCLIRGDTSLPDVLLGDKESIYQGERPYMSYSFTPDITASSSVRSRNSLCR